MRNTHVVPENTMDALYTESNDPGRFSAAYLAYLARVMGALNMDEIADVINVFKDAYRSERTVYFIGNGGSAATASHFATDLGKGTKVPGKRQFKAMSLTDNVALMTAQANDEGYDSLFVGQLESFLQANDVLVGITASGNSQNLIDAFTFAKERGATTVGLLGFDGGKLYQLSDYSIVVRTPKGEYGPVEDLHMVMDHLITNYLKQWIQHESA